MGQESGEPLESLDAKRVHCLSLTCSRAEVDSFSPFLKNDATEKDNPTFKLGVEVRRKRCSNLIKNKLDHYQKSLSKAVSPKPVPCQRPMLGDCIAEQSPPVVVVVVVAVVVVVVV